MGNSLLLFLPPQQFMITGSNNAERLGEGIVQAVSAATAVAWFHR
jgi:hypothetical protein